MTRRLFPLLLVAAIALPASARAQGDPLTQPYSIEECSSCAEWNAPRRPLRLFGNTYYVGTDGLAAVLVASPGGHVLIDGGLPDSAPRILANIRALGFDPADVGLILNSHPHYDHAGGIAALQRATGARVAARAPAAEVLRKGNVGPDDPQHAIHLPMPPVREVATIADGETIRAGALSLTAHATPGHTPGGTSWTWRSCEQERCLDIVYADSLTPVSADGFFFGRSDSYPSVLTDFERAFEVLERIPCAILITPHPGASSLWERVAAGPAGLVDAGACAAYAARARKTLDTRLERERRQAAGQKGHR